ncbi:hypothetical protein BDF14DRAFT_1880860 [Spinellus fusiger]|nr:hypothetical protein BDF14DRAFT_1880860 [Spinellus fusiger]
MTHTQFSTATFMKPTTPTTKTPSSTTSTPLHRYISRQGSDIGREMLFITPKRKDIGSATTSPYYSLSPYPPSALFMQPASNEPPWTSHEWKQLETWYVTSQRDVDKATKSFYLHVSLQRTLQPNGTPGAYKERWSRDSILWRCQCLDTNVRFRYGRLPSERERKRKRMDTVETLGGKVTKPRLSRQSSSVLDWLSEHLFS